MIRKFQEIQEKFNQLNTYFSKFEILYVSKIAKNWIMFNFSMLSG